MPSIDHIPRTAAADEDGGDHIGYETPRSGVATPQPDLQDKRLPGIMSYFGQVRQDPLATQTSSLSLGREAPSSSRDVANRPSSESLPLKYPNEGALPDSDSLSYCNLGQGGCDQQKDSVSSELGTSSHLYPLTPPASQPPSSGGSFRTERLEATDHENIASSKVAPADSSLSTCSHKPTNGPSPQTSSSPNAPSSAPKAQCHDSTKEKPPSVEAGGKWFSLGGLKGLTRGVFKSGPPTPTRALSTAQSSHSDGRDGSLRSSHDGAETSGMQTPRVPAGAQAPTPKGKLTIKIPEARGLRKCRDPYVVVVFQRSELISGGPRHYDDGETLNIPPPPGRGGIPIQRQGSDSGRPPMSIPMRSRQSSNTSVSAEPSSVRTRSARLSFTNPQWDAEAVLYVISGFDLHSTCWHMLIYS